MLDKIEAKKFRGAFNLFLCLFGRALFAFSVNVIITPYNFYSVGFTGIAQLLRTFCISVLHLPVPPGVDLLGIILFIINIPVMILAWVGIGKKFFLKTFLLMTFTSAAMALIPVPSIPIFEDKLTACLIGGCLAGAGAGITLNAGGSGGGQDVLGIYYSMKNPNFSVGRISIGINIVLFIACLLFFDYTILVYSFVFCVATSVTLDYVHTHNIKVQAEILSHDASIPQLLAEGLNRTVLWKEENDSTGKIINRITVLITKAEEGRLKQLLRNSKDESLVTLHERIRVIGHFDKRL